MAIDASGNIIQEPLAAASMDWTLLGNAGTVNGTNFLGTIDNQALDIRTNNIIKARFTTKGQLEVLNTGKSIYIGENAGNADPITVDKENVVIGTNACQNITTGATSNYHGKYTVGIGYNALTNLTRGHRNTAIGHSAAKNITTGEFNTALGVEALSGASTVKYAVGIGMDALRNAGGWGNTAVGYRALAGLFVPATPMGFGGNNTAIGKNAGLRNATGRDNVFIGKDVAEFNTGGNENVVIGTEAGRSTGVLSAHTGRIFIGYQAGMNEMSDNKLYIDNSSSATPLIGGDFTANRLSVNTDVSTLTHTFTVTGTVKITELVNLKPSAAPVSPAEGDVYYDSALKKLRVYTGATWDNLN